MKHLGKFALAALLTTAMALPAHAAGSGGSGSSGTSANNTVGSTSNNTVGSGGVGTNSSGTAGSRSVDSMTMYLDSDTDRSGTVSLDEYQAYNGSTGTRAQVQDDFRSLDTNRDNYLSQSELNARASGAIR